MQRTSILLAFCALLAPFAAQAQSPDLRIEPDLIVRPSPTQATTVEELQAAQDKTLPQLQKTLARIDAKVAALKAASLTYKYFIPMDRTRASQELNQLAQGLESDDTYDLRRCILRDGVMTFDEYQLDHTICRDAAAAAWNSKEIQSSPRLQILLEAMVFRTRNDLVKLQEYERELGINRLAYATEVRQFADRTANLEFQIISKNSAYQCNPQLGTVRLDEPSTVDGKPIVTSLQDAIVQNQGPLGTCYANAASVALEAFTSRPNSALDLAIRYSMGRTRNEAEISADFGGSFCGAIQIANQVGICERQDSWIEAAMEKSPAATIALQSLRQFIGRRSALPKTDWQLLEAAAPTLIPQVLRLTEGRPLTPLQSPVMKNLGALISGWRGSFKINQAALVQGEQNLKNYDFAHSDALLPPSGQYYSDDDRTEESLYREHGPGYIGALVTSFPSLSREFIEAQAPAFIRQGLARLTSRPTMDTFRAAVTVHQTIQSALQNQAQACANPIVAEQILFEVLTLADLSRKTQPGSPLDPVALAQNLFSTKSASVNDALLYTVAPRCQVQQNRVPIQPLSCQDHRPQSVQFVETKLLQSLSHGRPLGMSYCAEVLGTIGGPVARSGRCGGHESLLTGIRYNPGTQRCDVLIWNSWGKATGKTWVDTQRLLPFMLGLQELSQAAK